MVSGHNSGKIDGLTSDGEMWSPQGWDLSLKRNLNDREVCRLVEFFKRLESFQGLKEGRTTYVDNAQQRKIQSELKVTRWHASLGTLAKEARLTHDNRGNKTTFGDTLLFMWGGETVRHLYLHCEITDQAVEDFHQSRGIQWTMPSKVVDTLGLGGSGIEAKNEVIGGQFQRCIRWTIWRERNARCFEDRSEIPTNDQNRLYSVIMFLVYKEFPQMQKQS
ncbi:hypothetical protein H5410_057756 [Solanum commersonii]|uniref:Uncharacterized protein n=1 Tax=Solanum commersonii TaxID=4109 RepID=A0A9J5WRR1_SOLCO|nr:hypothetical protein H5410_057756 [Solanum commersonii]